MYKVPLEILEQIRDNNRDLVAAIVGQAGNLMENPYEYPEVKEANRLFNLLQDNYICPEEQL